MKYKVIKQYWDGSKLHYAGETLESAVAIKSSALVEVKPVRVVRTQEQIDADKAKLAEEENRLAQELADQEEAERLAEAKRLEDEAAKKAAESDSSEAQNPPAGNGQGNPFQ